MRRFVLIFLLTFMLMMTAYISRAAGWCGYALLEGLPLLDNQLAVLAAITPPKSAGANPGDLFQYRFSLDHTKVIIEGCWQAYPTYDLISTLLTQTVSVDAKYLDPILVKDLEDQGVNLQDPIDLGKGYIDSKLTYSIFAPSGTRDESAAAVRAYLASDPKEWEQEDE